MRFGVMNFCTAPYGDLARRFRAAEQMGFDSAWVDDDILTPGYSDFEAWTLLAALARETERIRLGTLVAVPPFRQPAILAAQAITVDHVSGGRAELGLGAGGPPNNYAALGYSDWSPTERAERLEEQVAILTPLLRGRPVTYQGRYHSVRDAQLTAPVQRPGLPLIIAAHGMRGLRIAAQYADGWNSLGGQPYPMAEDPAARLPLDSAVTNTQRWSERLNELCADSSRDPSTIRRSVLAYRPVPDPLASLDAFDEYVGRYREIGIDEIVFYWPPLDNLFPIRSDTPEGKPVFEDPRPVSRAQQAAFEKIAGERIANRS